MKSDYDVGELKDRINILRAANDIDDAGNLIKNPYAEYSRTWANIYDKTTITVNVNGELIHVVSTEITVRYRTDILESDQIIDYVHNRVFKQIAPAITTANRKWLVLICQENIKYGEANG